MRTEAGLSKASAPVGRAHSQSRERFSLAPHLSPSFAQTASLLSGSPRDRYLLEKHTLFVVSAVLCTLYNNIHSYSVRGSRAAMLRAPGPGGDRQMKNHTNQK
jgi:hypothetical protein